jgi:integrase/recombinase XerD
MKPQKSPCNQFLPLELWPNPDREAWIKLQRTHLPCAKGAKLMANATRSDLERSYSYFLSFVLISEGFNRSLPAAGHLTPERVKAYVARLEAAVKPETVLRSRQKLCRAAEILAPSGDWKWLRG